MSNKEKPTRSTMLWLLPLLVLQTLSQARAQRIKQRLQQLVDSVYAANPQAVGFSVHVEAPERGISWSYAAGVSNRTTREKLTSAQPVLIASNTKPYVAAAVLRLVEQGKLELEQPIGPLLTAATAERLAKAGYQLDSITLTHLLAHTSGIRDYVDEAYFAYIGSHQQHAWTRNEQIARSIQNGGPLARPGTAFRYADINYVLLTEIIEQRTHRPFYRAMRAGLRYAPLGLKGTRFAKLERVPKHAPPPAHQYWDKFGFDTYKLDPSWDLYGGGGMLATPRELALFFRYVFEGRVIRDPRVLARMTQDVPPDLTIEYCLGIRKIRVAGLTGYTHGGGLGTDVVYLPALNATVAIAALEAGHRPQILVLSRRLVQQLQQP